MPPPGIQDEWFAFVVVGLIAGGFIIAAIFGEIPWWGGVIAGVAGVAGFAVIIKGDLFEDEWPDDGP